jgi:hypothetical protein
MSKVVNVAGTGVFCPLTGVFCPLTRVASEAAMTTASRAKDSCRVMIATD